jgi:subtilisin family serine protease
MQLSGTSFAAPVVAGAAAYLHALHPNWGPDQVKGALMLTAREVPQAQPYAGGVGEVNIVAAAVSKLAPNPNLALRQFVVPDPAGGSIPVFDAVSWYDAAMADVSWSSVSWADVSWSSVSWSSVSWADVSWSSVSWADVSWSDVSWADVSWADSAKEDAILAEPTLALEELVLSPDDATELLSDPDLHVDPSLTDSALDQLVEPVAAPVAVVTAPVTGLLP